MRNRILDYRQQQVLRYAQEVIEKEGSAPTYAMIVDELGIGTKGEVSRIIASLERRGFLRRVGTGRVRHRRPSYMLTIARNRVV